MVERDNITIAMAMFLWVGVLLMPLYAQADPAAGAVKLDIQTGIEFVWIPAGCFMMGSGEGDKAELPLHKVCFREGFWLGRYEVTQEQYRRVMGENPSKFRGNSRPVESVSWNHIRTYIGKLNQQTGKHFRLPSEAEWEYACKAGRNSKFCGSDDNPDQFCWSVENSGDMTHDTGGMRANDWGLYDMSGNVREQVQDCYHNDYRGAPTDGSAWQESGCMERLYRGGSWNSAINDLRSSNRISHTSSYVHGSVNGFRLVQSP